MSAIPAPIALRPRLDRLFQLSEAHAYPGSGFVDMVGWIPNCPACRNDVMLRVWLRTGVAEAQVDISNRRFTERRTSTRDPRWRDFGTVSRTDPCFGNNGFCILRVFGLSFAEVTEAILLVTCQMEREPCGDRSQVEREFAGICREDAGRTTLTPARVQVGTPTEFVMAYEAGACGLPPGTLMRLAFPKAFSEPRPGAEDGDGALTVNGDRPATPVYCDTSIESHERLDVVYRLPQGLPPGGRLRFAYRTAFTYLFNRTWDQTDRQWWYSMLPPLSVAVAVDERQVFVPPVRCNGHTFRTVAGPPERLHLFLPGRLSLRDPVALRGLFTDHYRNPAGPGPILTGFELELDGPVTRALKDGADHFCGRDRFSIPLGDLVPGVYRAKAVDAVSGEVIASSNPMEVMSDDDPREAIYWGEIHGHTEQSDGSGEFSGMFRHARQDACLDFAAGADHACYFSDNEWLWMQDTVNSFNEPGAFVTLIGYEWAGRQGHRNVYTCRDRLRLFRGMYPGQHRLDAVYDHFEGDEDIVAGPHTRHTADFHAYHNPEVQRFLEVCSMWGTFEDIAYDALNRGAVIGLTGGGDCHEARVGFSVEDPDGQGTTPHTFAPGLRYKCGVTAAVLPELTRRALVSALRERRTYASTGPRILLDFTINGVAMGGVCPRSDSGVACIAAGVHAVSAIATLEIVRGGQVVHAEDGIGLDQQLAWTDHAPPKGGAWYLLKVTQTDREQAWSSPIWVH